jgi:N-formylmaleamate deformylase
MLPHWTQGDVMVGGDSLHYYRTGAGEKPALVLAHGFSDNGLCWLPVARDLESDYDVILPDARGHGKSQRVRPGEPLDQPADLANLIRGLGLSQVVVGGHSMGGRTATEFGARYPELARALLLEDPAWRLPEEPAPQAAAQPEEDEYSRFLRTAHDLPVEAIIARCRKNDPRWPEVEHYPWAISKQQFDPNFLVTRSRSHPDWREMAAKIRCPVLLITSDVEQGAIVSVEVAELAMKINPCIEVAFIPDAGHNIRRDNYAGYMAAVNGFLKGLA